jgi:hypothetical protein
VSDTSALLYGAMVPERRTSSAGRTCGVAGEGCLTAYSVSNSSKKKYFYYRCSSWENGRCSNRKNYRADELEALVGQTLADTLQYDQWKAFVDKTCDQKIEDLRRLHRSDPQKTRETPIKRIGALEAKMTRLVDLFTDGDISKDIYRERKSFTQDQIKVVRQELSRLGDFDREMRFIELQRDLLMVLAPDPFGEPKVHINGDPDDPDAEAFIDDYSIFTDRRGEEASGRRREFYRQVKLRVKVGHEMEISLNIGANPVSKSDDFSCLGVR